MVDFHITRIAYQDGDGPHRATCTVEIGAASVDLRIMRDQHGTLWIPGLRFGEPLRTHLKAACLRAYQWGVV